MKKIHKRRIKTKSITIDLDNLYINYDNRTIYLSRQPCNYGGARYYFVCPECCKLSYKLFKVEGSNNWKCNTCIGCIGLKTRTLNRTKTDCTYYWALAVKEIQKIDPTYIQDDYLDTSFKFPPRPYNMRYKKYLKHYKMYRKYRLKGNRMWLNSVSRLK